MSETTNLINNNMSNVKEDSSYSKKTVIQKDSENGTNEKIIVPMSPVCGTLDIDYWILDYFQPSSGKIIGICPTDERINNSSRLAQLKNKWGFNYILTIEGYLNNVTYAGYSYANVMLYVNPNDSFWRNVILNNSTCWAYYSDEPISSLSTPIDSLSIMENFINLNRPSSLFIAGETNTYDADGFDNMIDVLMCTRYCYDALCLDPNQRPLWNEFQQEFPTKFTSTWIGAHVDLSQYEELIEHARDMGLNQIWLYQQQDATDAYSDNNISTFCYYAWKYDWMVAYERQFIYTYRCIKPDPCDCNRSDLSDGWVLESIFPTSNVRIKNFN